MANLCFGFVNYVMSNPVKEETLYHGKEAFLRQTAFSLGGIPMNLPWVLVTSFLMFFLTDIALIPATVVSGLFLFCRFFDAVNDPLIGLMADNTKSRHGRYRPWMLAGALGLIPAVVLLFWAHPEWSQSARSWYACILYCVTVVFATMWDIPYGALNSCITPYAGERARYASSRILISSVACAVGSALFTPLVTKFSGAEGNAVNGYVLAALVISVCALPFAFITFFGTKEVVYPPKGQKISVKALIGVVVKNPPLLCILSGFFVYGFLQYGRGTCAMYYFSYSMNNMAMFPLYNLVNGLLSGGAAFFGASVLIKIFKEKKTACIFGYVLLLASCLVMYILDAATTPAIIMLLLLWIGSLGTGLVTGMVYGMIPDTVEYGQWKSGVRTDGFIYAGASFMLKLGGAVGPALLGVLLAAAGYVPNEAQSASALAMINGCMNLLPAVLCAIAIVFLIFYKLNNKLHAQIREELAAREQ